MMKRNKKLTRSTYIEGNNTTIPEDILYDEVLTRLPVKSLLRFKSVSKHWYVLISSHGFSTLHLRRQLLSASLNVLIQTEPSWRSIDPPAPKLLTIGVEQRDQTRINTRQSKESHLVQSVLDYNDATLSKSELIGSCNGLICSKYSDLNKFLLWNPTTRQQHEIRGIPCPRYYILHSGFGHDSKSDDYKIIVLGQTYPGNKTIVYLFSLKANKWTSLKTDFLTIDEWLKCHGFNRSSHGEKMPVQVGSTLNWLIMSDTKLEKMIVLSFDLANDSFSTINLPKKTEINWREVFLCKFRNSLCVCWMTLRNRRYESKFLRRLMPLFKKYKLNKDGLHLHGWKMINELGTWKPLSDDYTIHFPTNSDKYIHLYRSHGRYNLFELSDNRSVVIVLDGDNTSINSSCECTSFLFTKSHGDMKYQHKASLELPWEKASCVKLKCSFSYVETLLSPSCYFGRKAQYMRQAKNDIPHVRK